MKKILIELEIKNYNNNVTFANIRVVTFIDDLRVILNIITNVAILHMCKRVSKWTLVETLKLSPICIYGIKTNNQLGNNIIIQEIEISDKEFLEILESKIEINRGLNYMREEYRNNCNFIKSLINN